MANYRLVPVEHDPFAKTGVLIDSGSSTNAQLEIWSAIAWMPQASLAFNESITVSIDGPLCIQTLTQVLRVLPQSHDALRLGFSDDGREFCIARQVQIELQVDDLQSKVEADQATTAMALQETQKAFLLSEPPLFRARLLILAKQRFQLVLTGHHLILDGWSLAVILKDICALYRQISAGNASSGFTDTHQFADYARYLAQSKQQTELSYWRQRLANPPELALPLKSVRPALRTFEAGVYQKSFDMEVIRKSKQQAREQRCSFVTYLLAAFSLALQQFCDQDDIVIGVPAAGQAIDARPELVGHCVNLLPFRYQIDPDQTWLQYLTVCHQRFLEDWQHSRVSFGTLLQHLAISRDASRIPLVPVVFNIDTKLHPRDLSVPGLNIEYEINPRQFESFELFINCTDAIDRFHVCCQYNQELFGPTLLATLFDGFERLLGHLLASSHKPLSEISMTDEAAIKERACHPRPFAIEPGVAELVRSVAVNDPQRVAVLMSDQKVSYQDLMHLSDYYVRMLNDAGIRAGDRVGVCLPRSPQMIAALLAIWQCRAAYVPLDPTHPPARLQAIFDDADLAAYLVSEHEAVLLNDSRRAVKVSLQAVQANPAPVLDKALAPFDVDAVAYIIYTSGTTGKPKGVVISHRAVQNFLAAMADEIEFHPAERLLAVTTIAFDISVLELFLPLSRGGSLVLATEEESKDGYRLRDLIEAFDISLLQATPSTWKMLLLSDFQLKKPLKAICGGEPLSRSLADALLARGCRLWNAYGPTEATVWATTAEIFSDDQPIHVGKVLANYEAYILDRYGRWQGFGVRGELALAGPGLAVGYFNQHDLTAERFRIDATGRRMYLTGDVARMLPDGRIELFGRNDAQVKVRGFRIELQDIETCMLRLPEIYDAVVILLDKEGEQQLVAYLCGSRDISQQMVLNHCQEYLPEYMVPNQFHILDALPRLANGKIDRRNLKALSLTPKSNPGSESFQAKTDLERTVLEKWQAVLKTQMTDRQDDFFALGGHSLLAMQLIADLNQTLQTELRMYHLFQNRSFGKFLAFVEKTFGTASQPIAKRCEQDRRASPAQMRMWFVEQSFPNSALHNLPAAWHIKGPLEPTRLRQAFQALMERQLVMSMSIAEKGGAILQNIHSESWCLPYEDLSAETRGLELCQEQMQAMADEPIAYEKFPLFRAKLYKIAENDFILFFVAHHLIWDGWCFDIFLNQLDSLYKILQNGEPLPAKLAIDYGDYSSWMLAETQSDRQQRSHQFWLEQFKPLPPLLALPQDKPRPPVFHYEADVVSIILHQSELDKLESFCRQRSTTPFAVVLSCYYLALRAMTRLDDIVIGCPIRGRQRPEFENLLGAFIQLLPIRINLIEAVNFIELLGIVERICQEAFAHEDLSLDKLLTELSLKRDASHTPLFRTILSYQDVSDRQQSLAEFPLEQILVPSSAVLTDLFLWVKKGRDQLEIGLDFYTGLWQRSTATSFLRALQTLLTTVVLNPELALDSLPMLNANDWQALIDQQGPLDFQNSTDSLFKYIRSGSESCGASLAIQCRSKGLSYDELWHLVERKASFLAERGLRPGHLAAVMMDRSEAMVCVLLAIWRVGAGYVPIDPDWPAERVSAILQDAKPSMLLVDDDLYKFPGLESWCPLFRYAELRPSSSQTPAGSGAPTDPAYVIYTSGSTGTPKGVVIQQAAVINFLEAMQSLLPLPDGCRTLAITTITFDISILEIFLTLAVGGRLYLATRVEAIDTDRLQLLMQNCRINLFQATPVTWRMLVAADWQGQPSLLGLCGGEALDEDLKETLRGRLQRLFNVYGPTEATVWATASSVFEESGPVTIGKSLLNYHAYVLDDHYQPCPPGFPGKLCLAGPSLASGYLNRPELTRQQFFPAPWNDHLRLYDTGDRARLLEDGRFLYLGRDDFQIKLRGYRIEPGEIERNLLDLDSIEAAVVSVWTQNRDDQRLVAYIVNGQPISDQMILAHLRRHLPAYMLPNIIMRLEHLPLTSSGKINRKALPTPDLNVTAKKEIEPPIGNLEAGLAEIWREQLGEVVISRRDNFFDLGGHSLLALKVLTSVQQRFGGSIMLRDLLSHDLAQLAAMIEQQSELQRGDQSERG